MDELILQRNSHSGEYTGTGEQITIPLYGIPTSIVIFNTTDGDTTITKYNYMENSTCIVERTVGQSLKRAKLLEDGITFNGTSLVIGTSSYVNSSGDVYGYEVFFK